MDDTSISDCQAIAGSIDCSSSLNGSQKLSSFTVGPVPGYFGIISDVFSGASSLLIICIFIAWKDIRQKGAQSIVTFIAISDLLTALAYMLGASNMLVKNHLHLESCGTFQTICEIESYVVSCSIMSSYFWTIILAFYLYLTLSSRRQNLASKMMPLYHVIAWGIPVLVALPLLASGNLSYAPFVSSIWCRMETDSTSPPFSSHNTALAVFVTLPEIVAYVVILVLYIVTRRGIKHETAGPFVVTHVQRKVVAKDRMDAVNRILSLIPVTFIFLRVWSTIQYCYTLYLAHVAVHHGGHCIPSGLKTVHIVLAVFQAIFGGGQGWANGILYILFSPTIRRRLYNSLCEACSRCCICCCSKRHRGWSTNTVPTFSSTTTVLTPSKEPSLSISTRLLDYS